jgi:TRAP-type C4-dicarboxylate transport system permease small subunit
MDLLVELVSALVVFGLGWLLCSSGYDACKTKNTRVKGTKITGWWASFVGVLQIFVGLPLLALSVVIAITIIVSIVNRK